MSEDCGGTADGRFATAFEAAIGLRRLADTKIPPIMTWRS